MQRNIVEKVVTLALLIALEIILTRFLSINTPIVRIGFGFLPVAVCGILYGPLWAGAAYACGDILGMLIFPSGQYFPGFTATAVVTGVIYGLYLYKKEVTWPRVILASMTVLIISTLCLNTLWLSILYGNAFLGMLPTRIMEAAILWPVQVVTIKLVNDRLITHLPQYKESRAKA